ncbi:phosphoglycerate mutase-like protein [Exidia glandulosa HHB12029]|uniref:Phosphoglycerate mutase-like protein n=1 Tax=Exidia glandulosa HHB12029 TaxID=1314781 RepID=A0A165EIS5_EXIGL|nr:phosphoglycerate mutase-like protein [Exidia glandulosa HHB12029]
MDVIALSPPCPRPTSSAGEITTTASSHARRSRSRCSRYVAASFVAGVFACAVVQYAFSIGCAQFAGARASQRQVDTHDGMLYLAPEHAGKTVVHDYPPAHPTNSKPEFFPTNVGYAGPTPTGAEAALVATAPAYPMKTEIQNLLGPTPPRPKGSKKDFDMFKYWGNLSPWYSIPKGTFGVDSTPEAPDGCRVTALHFLHRHGARYPTNWASYGGPVKFASRLHEEAANWDASGELSFLNDWTYKLGSEILTPFGRQQMFDLGISLRIKYGFLLENSTAQNALPVFRTESQDRMLHSALNFAAGFFGIDNQDKYLQSITIEADGFNNTLCPYKTCPNARDPTKSDRAIPYIREWAAIYLKDAQKRLQGQIKGFDLTTEDVYIMQQTCAYETVALGYSSFCELFTQEEWEGFEYALDLYFWYDSAFGAPTARVQGIGYVQELVARLTETPIAVHNSSTNSTLNDNPITFPLGNSLYVDATHEVVVLNVITALNLSNFAATGPLPSDHIPENRSFIASQLAPFGTNIQFQVLSCEAKPEPQLRIIINDGVSPLTGVKGCTADKHGIYTQREECLSLVSAW